MWTRPPARFSTCKQKNRKIKLRNLRKLTEAEIIPNFSGRRFVSRYLLCFAFACGWMDAAAYRAWAVGSNGLGATFDADETHVTFRVYSSRATRIEVWLYDQPTDSAEKASVALDADPQTGIWSKSIAVADLAAKGIAGTIYYDYRAWGPNWPFDPAWKLCSTVGYLHLGSDSRHYRTLYRPGTGTIWILKKQCGLVCSALGVSVAFAASSPCAC